MHTGSGVIVRRWCAVAILTMLMTLPVGIVGAASPPKPIRPVGIAGGSPPPAKPAKAKGSITPKPQITPTSTKTYGLAQKLTEPTNSPEQYFGKPVTISKDNMVAVVSATQSSDFPGTVYVYTRDPISGQWITPPAQLPMGSITDVNAGYQFGFSTAINDDANNRTILVGTRGGNGNIGAPGAAYAFVLSGGVWTFQHEFNPTGTPTNDAFGWSVALSDNGNTALIGAPETNVAPTNRQGVVYSYTRTGTTWTQRQRFTDTVTPVTTGDHFGASVSLSDDGTIALIGADSKNNYLGDAFVYTGSGGIYSGEQLLAAGDSSGGDGFGWSLSLSGDGKTALVGAFNHVDPDTTRNPTAGQTGSAYVFINNGVAWGAPQELNEAINTQYDLYGYAVAISGDGTTAVIGAAFFGDPAVIATSNYGQGAVWVYVLSGGTFVGQGQQPLLAADATENDEFGVAVAAPQVGTTFLAGASTKAFGTTNTNEGQVYDYVLSPDLAPPGPALPAGTVGTIYTGQQFTATGGSGTGYTFTVAPLSTLPPGLMLSSAGLLSGTPTQAGDYSFSVSVTDSAGGTTTQDYTLHVNPGATTTAVSNVTVPFSTTAQSVTLTATVTNGAPVNEGTVSFTIAPFGSAVVSGTVVNGVVPATAYPIPANTAPGQYTITATYSPGPDYITSMGTGILTVGGAPTTTTVSNATTSFSASAQNVTLSGTVSAALPVNEGTVTFTVSKNGTPVGTPVTSGTVANGVIPGTTYVLPAGSAAGAYVITAVYTPATPTPTFQTSTSTGTLTVSADATTTAVSNATAPFSASAQNVSLAATVSNSTNATAVNEGTVTFTVSQGGTQVGSPVTSGTVANGAASAIYSLPAGSAAGAYVITAVYTPGPNFTTSTGTGTLTVSASGANPTTTTVSNASVPFSASAQNVSLAATVTDGVAVNGGSVTFTVSQGGTQIGSPVTSGTVANGAASATYTLPAGTAAGAYTITAVYTPGAGFTASSGTGTLTVTAATVTVTGVTVTAANGSGAVTLKVGQSVQFKATGTLSDGNTVDLTNQVVWQSNKASVTINGQGLATGVSASVNDGGAATVTATYGSGAGALTGHATVTVGTPVPVGIAPPPAPPGRGSGPVAPGAPSGPPPAPLPPAR